MDEHLPQRKLVKRAKNFHWNSKVIIEKLIENSEYLCKLYDLRNDIISMLPIKKVSTAEILGSMFSNLYGFAIKQDPAFGVFHRESPFYDDVFETCLYTALCMFLHNTKRVKSKSLRRFVYDNSPENFNEKGSDNYYLFEDAPDDRLLNDDTALRQHRYRLFSLRPVYENRQEWSGMAADSEYEWGLWYDLKIESDVVRDTYKRIGNLYKEINKAIQSHRDESYSRRLKTAYQKFRSKLSKIKYENYLELQKTIFSYLNENTKYYGLNVYRLEKEMRPSIITYEVNSLMKCKTDDEKKAVILNSILLHNIWFPRLYIDFVSFPSVTEFCAKWFPPFLDHIIISGCLILDELIDNKNFGENWENEFLDIVNEISSRIFPSPNSINWTATAESQNKFETIMDAYIRVFLSAKCNSK